MTDNVIASLYGYNKSELSPDEVKSVTDIDLLTFYQETRADVKPIKCNFNRLDCIHIVTPRYMNACYHMNHGQV